MAERITEPLAISDAPPLFVDCNAVSPTTVNTVADVIRAAGGRAVDVGIIGPPRRDDSRPTRFYASGPDAEEMAGISGRVWTCG